VPWSTVGRVALESGNFPPLYRSVTEIELERILTSPMGDADGQEEAMARWWRTRYARGGGGRSWIGCDCKEHPWALRLQGRVIAGYGELGDILPEEAGLAWAPGWNASLEPVLDWSAGVFRASLSGRLAGRVAAGGEVFRGDEALAWPGWPMATGRAKVRDARLSDGAWVLDVPRFLVGVQLGDWSLSAGWAPRRTGPGLTGALVLDYSGASFPALTARRTRPFRWPGRLDFLAPDNLLLRAGQVSRRNIRYQDPWGYRTREGRPWFFQWLLGWEVTSWFRTTFTHTVMAAAREGTLWPDLLQINFPLIGTTWREAESGPITDRLFAVQLEFRWRHAPWPLLPSTAGRIFWDYAGTDFLPSGPGGLIPEISIPASVAGCELVSPRWDLGFEYAETVHEKALWYSNGGYEEGYSHRSWLLGHPLGGAGESFTGLVRYRPAAWPLEAELKGRHAVWEHPLYIQGTGKCESVALAVGKRPESADGPAPGSPLLWQLTAEYVNEEAVPLVSMAQTRHWWRVYLKLGR